MLEFAARLIALALHVEFLLGTDFDQSLLGVSPGEWRQLIMIRESDQSAGVFTLAELRGTIGAGQEHRRLRDSICDFSGL